jgi:hypothetical protein
MMNPQEQQSGEDGDPEREMTIVVNGRKKEVQAGELTFSQVVQLAFETPPQGPNIVFTVTYRRGEGDKQGTLVDGERIKVHEGMIFNVTATDKS